MNTGAIILAAGSSSRLGQSKQMLDINGERLLIKTIQAVLHARMSPVVVVLGANSALHHQMIKDLPVDVVVNQDWKRGIGSSLKTGLSQITLRQPALESVILLVCDQPLLDAEHLSRLLAKYAETRKPMVASRYDEMPGVPALFHKSYFPLLAGVGDNEGAKKILLQNAGDVSEVDFAGGAVDIDTPEDYQRFRNRKSHPSGR